VLRPMEKVNCQWKTNLAFSPHIAVRPGWEKGVGHLLFTSERGKESIRFREREMEDAWESWEKLIRKRKTCSGGKVLRRVGKKNGGIALQTLCIRRLLGGFSRKIRALLKRSIGVPSI